MSKTYLDEDGYYRFSDSKRLVHRHLAYKHLYSKDEFDKPFSHYVVHHIDHNKRNNSIENLQIMTYEAHEEHHEAYRNSSSRRTGRSYRSHENELTVEGINTGIALILIAILLVAPTEVKFRLVACFSAIYLTLYKFEVPCPFILSAVILWFSYYFIYLPYLT